jgi:hypothetical protein
MQFTREIGETEAKGAFWRVVYFNFETGKKVIAPLGIHLVIRWWKYMQYAFMSDKLHAPLFMEILTYEKKKKMYVDNGAKLAIREMMNEALKKYDEKSGEVKAFKRISRLIIKRIDKASEK